MKRLQSKAWMAYCKAHPKARIMKAMFSSNHHVCVYGKGWCHWCNDDEEKNVFSFIREHQNLFVKDACNPRVFKTIDANSFLLNEVKGKNIMENKFNVVTSFGSYEVMIEINHYSNNNVVAVDLIDCKDLQPFATITVNICDDCNNSLVTDEYCSFIDTNNCPWALEFLFSNNLAEPTGVFERSGYCIYPEVRFKKDTLELKVEEQEIVMSLDEYLSMIGGE